jgi:hypothetical protein
MVPRMRRRVIGGILVVGKYASALKAEAGGVLSGI